MRNFWEKLPKPFFALAPLDDVTDAAFRRHIAGHSSSKIPRVMYTEFTSADGLLLADESGKRKLLKKLEFSDIERPIVAQLFTAVPEHMEKAAALCRELGFDGVDINMGCPDKAVEKSGCGADLIRHPDLACELIRAAKRGACICASLTCTNKKCLPVSVKTRLGYDSDELETWLPAILAEEPAAVAIHLRTRKEMSDVPAKWERAKRAVEIRDALGSNARIIGNGDVKDIADARANATETGVDGVMLGRAVFGNPWLFAERDTPPSPSERVEALIEHLALFEGLLGGLRNYATMKKHFKAYISGWPNASILRASLMETDTCREAVDKLREASHT
jgi:tRNA-dihydrouridine synthase